MNNAVGTRMMSTIAVMLALATNPLSARATGACDTFMFYGETEQLSPVSPFIGDMTLVNLETGEQQVADVVTVLLGELSADGSRLVTSHEITGGNAPGFSLVTFDDVQLLPPQNGSNAYSLISRMDVRTGKGAYNCGTLVTSSGSTVIFDQGGGQTNYQGMARLCRCKPADN